MTCFDTPFDDTFISIEPKSNIFLQYRDTQTANFKVLSARDFAKIWKHYDKDGK